jgi:hypothetical protein
MDAENLEVLTAVRLTDPAGVTRAAAEVWFNGAAVAGPEVVAAGRRFDDLGIQLVTEDARVPKKRLPALEGVQVSAADPDAVDADEGLARPGLRGLGDGAHELTGLL